MSYTPTTWTTGDTITATAMNKIENGIANAGGGTGGVIINDTSGTLDKTFAEIYDLLNNGTPCFIRWVYNQTTDLEDLEGEYTYSTELIPIISVYKYNESYRIAACCTNFGTVSNDHFIGMPTIWTYKVETSVSNYPTFFRRAYVNPASYYVESNQDVA